jgi:hypothetical protein
MDKDEQLTRQEVSALIDVNQKVADQLAKIAERLSAGNALSEKVVSLQEKVVAELSNGLPKKIYEPVLTNAQQNGVKLDSVMQDQREVKWLVRCIGGVVGFVGLEKLAAAIYQVVKP